MFDLLMQENNTEYGVIRGNDRLFYVKVGNGGNVYGKENKYLRIAKQIRVDHGCTVLVASNSLEISVKEAMLQDSAFMEEHFSTVKEIFAFGNSKGGQMLAAYAYLNPKIRRVAAVNAPLMVNLHKTKAGIAAFQGQRMTLIYGQQDQSVRYADLLKSCSAPHFSYITIPCADHNFSNMLEEFISLPQRFLFE